MSEITLGYDKAPDAEVDLGRVITVNGEEYVLVGTQWGGSFGMVWHERYVHHELWKLRQAERYREGAGAS